ncbi:MAG TPA: PspC domain-containing protein [Nocardioides sp.]|nr:PspC domain-containing protein [Nocardioides sp.]
MTTTPPDTSSPQGPAPDAGPRVGWDDIRDLGRIRRSRADRKVAGVAGGLGRHLDVDPVILRVAFVVLTFFAGVGLLLYVALWLLLPEDGSDWATIKLDRRSRTVALFAVGALALVLLLSHGWWGTPGPVFFLAAIVGVVVVAVQLARRDRPQRPPGTGTVAGTGSVAGTAAASGAATPPVPSYVVPEQPRPVNPRKKGPILFWFSLAVTAVALGGLGIADLAGAHVAPSAYPATVLAVSAVFLLIGSFYGRAGGIILVGLLAAGVTVGTTIADRWDPHRTTVDPADASQVRSAYSMDVGELVVDLSGIRDPKALDGREITVTGNVGHLDIRVPDGVTVVANTHVTGIGGMNVFGRDGGGVDTRVDTVSYAGPGAPRLTIDAELHLGGIDVHTDAYHSRSLR